MRIAILGCGYVGSEAATYLKKQGHIVTVSTRDPKKVEKLKAITQNVILLKPDHSNEINLEPLLVNQDVVIVAVAPREHDSYYSTYLKTALQLRIIAPKFPNLRQIIYTSSTSVYGECDGRLIDEKEPVKREGEKFSKSNILIDTEKEFLETRSSRLNVAILRLGEIIGPGRELENRLRRMNDAPLPGTGENYANLSPLNLIVHAVAVLIRTNSNGIFNCCIEEHEKRKSLYDRLCKQLNIPEKTWDPTLKQQHAGNRRVCSWKLEGLMHQKAKL